MTVPLEITDTAVPVSSILSIGMEVQVHVTIFIYHVHSDTYKPGISGGYPYNTEESQDLNILPFFCVCC
jgi:hypothetical protein